MNPVELSELVKSGDIPWEFTDQYDRVYKRDQRALASLNKTLETDYKAVYRTDYNYKSQWKANDIDLDCGDVYVVTKSNRLLHLNNSEWFFIDEVKK